MANPIQLTETANNLTIIVDQDLVVAANILFPPFMSAAGAKSKVIRLVSLSRSVIINDGVTVGDGQAAAGTPASLGQGRRGGDVILHGVNINIKGRVIGNKGGAGTNANDANVANASATGKPGGHGGDVHLCALDSIRIGRTPGQPNPALVKGGEGGNGGSGVADGTRTARAQGRLAGNGRNVIFHGTNPQGTRVQVFNADTAQGGRGGTGGGANANTDNANNGGTSMSRIG